MTQRTFLDQPAHTLSRRSDPRTSSIAASEIAASGGISRMAEVCVDLIQRHPDRCVSELEDVGGFRYGQVGKRLAALEQAGRIKRSGTRTSAITGRPSTTWRIIKG